MRKLILIAISILVSLSIAAETRYVSSLKVKMYSKPVKNTQVVSTLTRGDRVQVKKVQDEWLYISSSAGTGWVQKLFTKETKPSGSISILGNKNKSTRIRSRVRASSEVTAASARGLLAENSGAASRQRFSGDRQSFNSQDIEEVESVTITEDELLRFLSQGKIQ